LSENRAKSRIGRERDRRRGKIARQVFYSRCIPIVTRTNDYSLSIREERKKERKGRSRRRRRRRGEEKSISIFLLAACFLVSQ
jgi:hypothetical protein